jgi:adenylosuccinate synthase
LDLVALRYAVQLNGVDAIALTKLDILSGVGAIHVATAYEIDGQITQTFPASLARLARARPCYETLPGWSESLTDTRSESELPDLARAYINYIERALGVPLRWISVGTERSQILERAS